ncbi:glycosyltransferase family 4 protein [Acetomicrobium sp.]|uniref:glycosyltransferase family 4 protein n=1 Tax=Acetomicrobium sp. TaxID=1872099 RepID=UPI002B256E16|nr:glycosyltransferase family 4 protein [Acetomicrobium sp.]
MKIAYITVQTPYGPGETFILPEVIELQRQGHEVAVFPLRPDKKLAQGQEAAMVRECTVHIPLLNVRVFVKALKLSILKPKLICKVLFDILRYSGSGKKVLKNLVVIPKGLVLGAEIKNRGFDHIHAHWASTPSTAAYIAALYSGVPWSFTAHRWDIGEGNMLEVKVKLSQFARTINLRGAKELKRQLPNELWDKVHVIHMGVNLSENTCNANQDLFTIACVGNMLPVKGHEFLLRALFILKGRNVNFRCLLFGDGPLRNKLEQMANELNLNSIVKFCGRIAHDEILRLYSTGDVSVVVLPSIETKDGEKEGIPVALMEAMAAGVPVISTTTGGIPELLDNGAGILVPPEDSEALANAIEQLFKDAELRRELGIKGREKVEKEFAIDSVVRKMVEMFKDSEESK